MADGAGTPQRRLGMPSGSVSTPTASPSVSDSPAYDPSQVAGDSAGHYRVVLSLHGRGGSLFSLTGPAAVGAVSGDHVSIFDPSTGLYVDTQQGNVCSVSFTTVTEKSAGGTARCDAENNGKRMTVRVAFTIRPVT
jgi:hypothetical protein